MSQIIAVSKAGTNVLTNTDPNGFNYSSDYNTLKYYQSGSLSLNIVGDGSHKQSQGSVVHNLGYVPYFIVYSDVPNLFSGTYAIVPALTQNFPLFGDEVNCEAFSNAGTLICKFTNQSNENYTANFYYKIYRNNLGI